MNETTNDGAQCTVCLSPSGRVDHLFPVAGELACQECADELEALHLL